jgi:ADP-L-glycero-D-manno-heptose 6-epimerase
MRIAVTGGLGFIGQQIVKRLIELDHEVTVVDFWERLVTRYERDRLPIIHGVYRTLSVVHSVVDPYEFLLDYEYSNQHDIIIHAGATVDTKDLGDGTLWENNVRYTQRLIGGLGRNTGVIFLSSAATYGAHGYPNNPYGLSKKMGERILENSLCRGRALRLYNVFGENEDHKGNMASVPWKLAQAYKRSTKFEMHSPDAKRDFVPVSAVVDAVIEQVDDLHATRNGAAQGGFQAFDVGTGLATSFADLDNYVMQATGNKVSCVNFIEMPPELVGRYQGYTCAGMSGTLRKGGNMTTRQGIEDFYGR